MLRFFCIFCCLLCWVSAEEEGVRLKDLTDFANVRDNHLHGVGLVVGLQGTGDGSAATVTMARQVLANKNLTFTDDQLSTRISPWSWLLPIYLHSHVTAPVFPCALPPLAMQAACVAVFYCKPLWLQQTSVSMPLLRVRCLLVVMAMPAQVWFLRVVIIKILKQLLHLPRCLG